MVAMPPEGHNARVQGSSGDGTPRILTIGAVPPELGGRSTGGVATTHLELIRELLEPGHGATLGGVLALNAAAEPVGAPAVRGPLPVPLTGPWPSGREQDQVAALAEAAGARTAVVFHLSHRFGYGVEWRALGLRAVASIQSWHSVTHAPPERAQDTLVRLQRALDRVDCLIFPSRHTLEEGQSLGLTYRCPCRVIPNPVGEAWIAHRKLPGGGPREGLVFVGALVARKRPSLALRAAATLGLPVAFVGAGEEEAALRALATELGVADRVRFTGEVGPAEVARELSHARALVVPSSSESFGNVYVEAAVCGTPSVGFGPTLREIGEALGEPIGAPVEPDEGEAAVIAAVREMLARPLADALEVRAAVIDRFSGQRVAGEYVAAARGGGEDDRRGALELRSEVLETIRSHLATYDVDPDSVVEAAVYGVDLEVDSLSLQTLAQELEDAYQIELNERQAAGLTSVALTIDHVVAELERAERDAPPV